MKEISIFNKTYTSYNTCPYDSLYKTFPYKYNHLPKNREPKTDVYTSTCRNCMFYVGCVVDKRIILCKFDDKLKSFSKLLLTEKSYIAIVL